MKIINKLMAAMLVLGLGTTTAVAQDDECAINISLYRMNLKAHNWGEAYPYWKEVVKNCPTTQLRTYADGEALISNLIKVTEDSIAQFPDQKDVLTKKKEQYVNDLMGMFDQELALLDQLNEMARSNPKTAKSVHSKGYIQCRKAYFYAALGGDNDKAYEMFSEGINGIDRENEEVDAAVLYSFFQVSYGKYKANTEFRAQFLQDYLDCSGVCDAMLDRAQGMVKDTLSPTYAQDTLMAQQYVNRYLPTSEYIENTFVNSGAADCASLQTIFAPKVEDAKSDLDKLNQILTLLQSFNCTDAACYYKASDYAYQIKPTYESAIGKASAAFKKGNTSEAIKYFDDALSMAPSNKKANIALSIAAIMFHKGNVSGCNSYCNKALSYNPSMGKAYLLIASCIARSASGDALQRSKYYCLAMDKCARAKAVDPGCAGAANRQIASYSGGLCRMIDYVMDNPPAKGSTVSVPGWGTTTMRYK